MQPHLIMTSSGSLLSLVLRVVPDLIICWLTAYLTASGWYGFLIALIVIQSLYFFLWLKTTLWRRLSFWLFRRQMTAELMEKFLIANRFPAPDKYDYDIVYEDYMHETANNEEFDATIRVVAAFELGTLNGLRSGSFSQLSELLRAGRIATRRYADNLGQSA